MVLSRMVRRSGLFLFLIILGLLSNGCGSDGTGSGTGDPTKPEKKEPKQEVTLKAVDHPELMSFIKEQKGKVVVLELWAFW